MVSRPNLAISLAISAFLCASATFSAAFAYNNNDLIDGFNKTVFGSEYSRFSITSPYVRKFPGTVKVFIKSKVGGARKAQVRRFVLSLNGLISGLRTRIVTRREDANFVVYVVTRQNYERTVRDDVYGQPSAMVRGRCMVRTQFNRSGITRSDAVIVADEGNLLFRRCMTEEILQGLGPLNDDRSLKDSMFNDTSRFINFRRFDRILLNMLYDQRIKVGASKTDVAPLLPRVLRDVRRRIEQR